jgi:hypothetical protein
MNAGHVPSGADVLTVEQRALCVTLAAWLHAARHVAALGLVCTAVALLGLAALACTGRLFTVFGLALAAVVLLGGAERVLALRLDFDARLFDALADGRLPTLTGLDAALTGLRLRPAGPSRALPARIAGTQRLLRLHVLLTTLQWLCLAASMLLAA